MAKCKNMFFPDYVVAPGAVAQEHLELFGWSIEELAEKCDLPLVTIKGVIEGTTSVTDIIASRFEKVLGGKAYLWLGLEKRYREGLDSGKVRVGDS